MRRRTCQKKYLLVAAAAAACFACVEAPPPRPPPPPNDWLSRSVRGEGSTTMELCQLNAYECERRALAGDARAAEFLWLVPPRDRQDPMVTFRWKIHAARLGDGLSLDSILWDFSPSGSFPNESKLKEFIELGVTANRSTALVAKAAYVQDTDPGTALTLYERAALNDHCAAQVMLAASYLDGLFTGINEAKAYFWWLVARRPRGTGMTVSRPPLVAERLKAQMPYFDVRGPSLYCPSDAPRLDALKTGAFAQEVSDLLLEWRPGRPSPEQLDRFNDTRVARPELEAAVVHGTTIRAPPSTEWTKLSLSAAMTLTRETSREDLYDRLSKSVYVVYAAPSKRALSLRENVAQGSGVAVERDTLLTNCHVVRNRPEVFVVVGGSLKRARVTGARLESDACVVRIEDAALSPVAGVKPGRAVRVGEEVLAIGSPSGFTNTLSVGIVSQHREREGTAYIQTTAQISPGSSGGGLFDRLGNLVGITTFKVAEAEGLNFAVAIDEFVELKGTSPTGRVR